MSKITAILGSALFFLVAPASQIPACTRDSDAVAIAGLIVSYR